MNRIYAINTEVTLATEECCNCHVVFAMPKPMMEKLQKEGGDFYCPNGHRQHYTETESMRLRRKLDQRENELNKVYRELQGSLKEITNKKRQITRLKNRVHNGVCPECHRHFTNLEEHMKTQHGNDTERETVKASHQKEK